jgi:hypothetical protein
MARERHDWPAIREAYRTTTKPQRQLALEYGVSPRALASRAIAEKWTELRLAYQEETAAKVQRETQARQVRAEVDTLSAVRSIGRAALTRFGRLLNAGAIELSAADFVNVAKLVLLLEGQLPAESVDVKLRQLAEKPPQELDDDQLDAEFAELADRYLRSRSRETDSSAQGESSA